MSGRQCFRRSFIPFTLALSQGQSRHGIYFIKPNIAYLLLILQSQHENVYSIILKVCNVVSIIYLYPVAEYSYTLWTLEVISKSDTWQIGAGSHMMA